MATITRRLRRSLRTTGADLLAEGCAIRHEPGDSVTIEIGGGTPSATATVVVGGVERHHVRLDRCGSARVELGACPRQASITVSVGDRPLLVGRLPGAVHGATTVGGGR